MAALNGQINIVKILVDEFNCSPFVQRFRNRTLLHAACQSNTIELIDLLIRTYQLDPMGKDDDGDTPLHIAAREGQVDTVKHLIIRVQG